jgi:hypothetical protein
MEEEDRDRVRSRLLDAVLDEKLLAEEADRRGVTVSQAEVVAYLDDVPRGATVADPEGARRHIAARKLQDALLRAVGPPPEAEVEALAVRMQAEAKEAGASVVLGPPRGGRAGGAEIAARSRPARRPSSARPGRATPRLRPRSRWRSPVSPPRWAPR